MAKAKLVLKELLHARNITQKELSQLAGIREASVSRLARGYVDRVDLEQISKIATALKVKDINEIITLKWGDDDKT